MELRQRELEYNEFLKNLKRGFTTKDYGMRIFDRTENPCHEIPFTFITPVTVCTEEIKIWDLSGMEVMKNFPARESIGLHGEAALEFHGGYGSNSFSIHPIVALSTGSIDPSMQVRKTHTLWQFYAMTGIDLRDTWNATKPMIFHDGLEAAEWLAAFWEEIADDIDGRLAGWAIQGGHVEDVQATDAIESFCKVVTDEYPHVKGTYRQEGKDCYEITFSYSRSFFREDAIVEIKFLLERTPLQQFAHKPYWQINPRRAEVSSAGGMKGDCLREKIPLHMKTMFLLMTMDAMLSSVLDHIDACEAILMKKDEAFESACIADDIADREASLAGTLSRPRDMDVVQ